MCFNSFLDWQKLTSYPSLGSYGALLQGRTAMVADGANVSKKALTIAVRYGAVRRQFKTADNEFETQLLDYPIHQRRLMPLLAQAIAMVSVPFHIYRSILLCQI